MNIQRKAIQAGFSLVFTILTGPLVLADDTELLLRTSPTSTAKPNVLFILDSSASMNSIEQVEAFYDSALPYDGPCDTSSYYWSDSGTIPVCAANNRSIVKAAFDCESAHNPVSSLGRYTGILAQYRREGDAGDKWQNIKENVRTATVKCAADSKKTDDDAVPPVYAQAGTNIAKFTDDPGREVDWGNSPVNQKYTLYDGNYLNFRANPETQIISRIDIMKAVLGKVLGTYRDVNAGLMHFNRLQGGTVIHAVSDLSANRIAFDAKLALVEAGGKSPLAETVYESALYWHGMPAHFGESVREFETDPNALVSMNPAIYRAPQSVAGSCARNFNILLTDGLPSADVDAVGLTPKLPNFEAVLGRATCSINPAIADNEGQCLDDISEYLSRHDISATPGMQSVTTFGVGFLAPKDDLDLVEEAAKRSGGQFFLADDPEGLSTSLLAVLDHISEKSLTFAAPTVAVSAFNRTQNLNDIYLTVFNSKANFHWPGNLKKYHLAGREIMDANGVDIVDASTGFIRENAKSFWTVGGPDGAQVGRGGAANRLPRPAARKLYTYNGIDSDLTATTNAISTRNFNAFVAADFGLSEAPGEPTVAEIIRWANGEDIKDQDNNPDTMVRNAMGDSLHSRPAAIDYGTGGASEVVVFTATNDGYIHAVNAETGTEHWSFVPKELLSDMHSLYQDQATKYKHYGIDGDIVPVIADYNHNGEIDGADFVYIVFGMRRGGKNYYALDVTSKNSPRFLWNVNYPEFGQSWSTPVIAKVDTAAAGLNKDNAVVILAAGYDTVHDSPSLPASDDAEGVGLFMLDLATGRKIWRAGRDASADLQLATMTRAFPGRVNVVDIDGDGFADRLYAADVGGQIWRFDIYPGEAPSTLVTGGIIARLGLNRTSTRRTYNSPDVSIFSDARQGRRYASVSIGTGYRAHPLNNDAIDRFYSIRDPDVFNQLSQRDYDNYDIAEDDDLVEVSGKTQLNLAPSDKGWKFTLPSKQKVLTDSVTFGGSIYFVGFSPEADAANGCETTIGKNFLYRVSVINGDPVVEIANRINPLDADEARVTELLQGGIAPSPRFLFPSPDNENCAGQECAPPPLVCVGIECFEPGFANKPIRTLWTQDGID